MINVDKIGYHCMYVNGEEKREWLSYADLKPENPEAKKLVQSWLYGLANPLADNVKVGVVGPNANATNKDDAFEAKFIFPYYDGFESVAIAYGSTPEQAKASAQLLVNTVIRNYYEDWEEPAPDPTRSVFSYRL